MEESCPSNHIIAQGVTDKHGRYKIYANAKLWDEYDGLITTVAEFPGTMFWNHLNQAHKLWLFMP